MNGLKKNYFFIVKISCIFGIKYKQKRNFNFSWEINIDN